MWIGTMPESGIGAQAALALAAHEVFSLPTDVEPSDRWYVPGSDLVELTMRGNGTMAVAGERPDVAVTRAPLVFELDAGR
jgi:L-alanine-DL-glutamate epimerase-like enolase superfamily enzyme